VTTAALATLDHSPSTHSLPSICRGLFAVFVDALAEALAPRIGAWLLDHLDDIVEAKARADDQPLGIKKAARAIRISDAALQHACNEPVGSPWHLKNTRGEKRGGVGAATYLIQRTDLEVWDRDQRAGFEVELRLRDARE